MPRLYVGDHDRQTPGENDEYRRHGTYPATTTHGADPSAPTGNRPVVHR